MNQLRMQSLLLLISSFFLWGCTVAIPEVTTNSELKGNMIAVTSGESYTVPTLPTCSSGLEITGQCDARVTKLNYSLDEKNSWGSVDDFSSDSDGNCSDGYFKLKFSDVCASLKVGAGETVTKTVLLQGDFKLGATSVKSFQINFEAAEASEVRVSVQDAINVSEGSSAQFTVSLDRAAKVPVTVNYSTSSGTATAGLDYAEASGVVTFNPGETAKYINVTTNVDSIYETTDENFTLTIASATNATIIQNSASGVIMNATLNPMIRFATSSQNVNENLAGAVVVLTVMADKSSTQDMIVPYVISGTASSTGAGSDYTLVGGSVTITAGSTSADVNITIVDDAVVESGGLETIILTLQAETSGVGLIDAGNKIHTVSIVDNDLPQLTISDVSVGEGYDLVFTVTSTPVPSSNITVVWNTVTGTAVAGSDFTGASGTATIIGGNASTTITVSTLDDAVLCELDETFAVNLSNAVGADISDSSAVGTIQDSDRPTISVSDVSVDEGNGSNVVATLSAVCPNFAISFLWDTENQTAMSGSDYSNSTGIVGNIPANSTSVQLPITTYTDPNDEFDETFNVKIRNPTNVTIVDDTAVVTIIDNDSPPTINLNSPTVAENSNLEFTWTLTEQSGKSISVTFATANGSATSPEDYSANTGTLTIPAYTASGSVVVSVVDDSLVEPSQHMYFNLSTPSNVSLGINGTGTITDNDVLSPPSSISLVGASPNNDNTPTFTLGGVSSGDTVGIFLDSTCSIPKGTAIAAGSSVDVTLSPPLTVEGLYSVWAKRETSGSVSTCSSVSASYHFLMLNIAPVYTNAANWNSYIRYNGTDQYSSVDASWNLCDGTENTGYTSCIHGGEKRKVVLTGFLNCNGLSMSDNNEVFNWKCIDTSTPVVFYSQGFRQGRGLADLLSGSAWAPFAVSLYQNGVFKMSGTPSASIWGNQVQSLTGGGIMNLSADGKVYTVTSDIFVDGIYITADRVALVIPKNFSGNFTGNGNNCNSVSGESLLPDKKCFIYSGTQKFLWIEGAFNGNYSTYFADYNILLYSVKFSRMHNILSYYSIISGIYLLESSNNFLTGVRLAYHNSSGGSLVGGAIHLKNSNLNSIYDVTASNNNYGSGFANSSAGLVLENSDDNTLVRIISASNYCHGINLFSGSDNNVLAFANVFGNGNVANCHGLKMSNTSNSTLNNILALKNQGSGIHMSVNSGAKSALIFSRQNNVGSGTHYGIFDDNATSSAYFHKTVVDLCSVSGSSGISSSCTLQGGSTGSVSAGTTISSLSFNGYTLDGLNAKGSLSVPSTFSSSSLSSAFDYLSFQNPFRVWQKGSVFGTTGLCDSGSCGIWDFSLSTLSSSLRNFHSYSTSFTPQAACPDIVDGDAFFVVGGGTNFLSSAIEIMYDSVGDEDGLCETNETCSYAPHAGAFQSYHDPMVGQECSYTGSSVSGVKILGVNPAVMNLTETNSSLTLLNGSLTVQKKTGNAITASKADISKISGKWYFEVKIASVGSNSLANSTIGIGTSSSSLTAFVGSGSTSYGFDGSGSGTFYNSNVGSGASMGFGLNDTIGVAVDLDNGKLWYSKNGSWLVGDPASPVSLAAFSSVTPGFAYYPMVSIKDAGTGGPVQFTLNFGQSHFRYPVPTGFNPGWY